MNNKLYDVLKLIALVVLPAIGTLYFTLAGIWGFPYGEEIVGTITAIDTCLGTILGISNAKYNKKLKGAENIVEDPAEAERAGNENAEC